jgi:hypothetical protein
VASIYLGCLIGSGSIFNSDDNSFLTPFLNGLAAVEKYSTNDDLQYRTELSPVLKHGFEIQLYLTSKKSDARNKAAASLRYLARPDLAIQLTSQQLELTRLNYYSLVVRSAAYCDLSFFNKAITDGQMALKYSPLDKKHFPLVSLARAFVERFKQTGELSDAESAFELAEESFELMPNEYSANIFVKVIHTIGLSGMEELISTLRKLEKTNHSELDQRAVEIAKEVLRNSTPNLPEGKLTQVDDLLADELFEGWLELETDGEFEVVDEDSDLPEDYFEDYFEDFAESLSDPQSPHLEP